MSFLNKNERERLKEREREMPVHSKGVSGGKLTEVIDLEKRVSRIACDVKLKH